MKSKKKKPTKKFKGSSKRNSSKKLGLTFVKKAATKKLPLLDVTWKDHAVSGKGEGWRPMDNIKVQSLICYSVGYLVDEDKDAIAIAGNVSADGAVGEITTIVKS